MMREVEKAIDYLTANIEQGRLDFRGIERLFKKRGVPVERQGSNSIKVVCTVLHDVGIGYSRYDALRDRNGALLELMFDEVVHPTPEGFQRTNVGMYGTVTRLNDRVARGLSGSYATEVAQYHQARWDLDVELPLQSILPRPLRLQEHMM